MRQKNSKKAQNHATSNLGIGDKINLARAQNKAKTNVKTLFTDAQHRWI
jgi:hypothetical protein